MSGRHRHDESDSLNDADEIVSVLAHWITLGDDEAALLMHEGFKGAQTAAAAFRSGGASAVAIAGLLADTAEQLRGACDPRHAGWLLASVRAELNAHCARPVSGLARGSQATLAGELARDVDQLIAVLEGRTKPV